MTTEAQIVLMVVLLIILVSPAPIDDGDLPKMIPSSPADIGRIVTTALFWMLILFLAFRALVETTRAFSR